MFVVVASSTSLEEKTALSFPEEEAQFGNREFEGGFETEDMPVEFEMTEEAER